MYAQSSTFPSYQPVQPSGFLHSQAGPWKADIASSMVSTEDQLFVRQFERNVLAAKLPSTTHVSTFKEVDLETSKLQDSREEKEKWRINIPEVRSLLRRSSELIEFLKDHQDDDTVSQVSHIQLELDSIQHMVESSLDDIDKKVRRRARKRLRSHNNRQYVKLEHEKNCRETHEKLDQWLAEKEAKKLKLKMEKEVKLSAAEALQEVERKESDVLKYIKFVELLEKLKSHRSEIQHRSSGLITMEADQKFKNTAKPLQEFLSLRKEEYEKEKKALHVIMEEEVQDRIAAATASTQKPEQEAVVTLGQDGSATPQVAALLHIRQQWDAFLSSSGSPLPIDPLLPSRPSSAEWETFLVSS